MQLTINFLIRIGNKSHIAILILMACMLSVALPFKLQATNRHASPDHFAHNTSQSGYPITPFVVGPKGQSSYSTIQSAIDAAISAGGVSQAIFVQPGLYKENLDFTRATALKVGLTLVGATALGDEGQVEIIGRHIPPDSGTLVLRNFRLSDKSAIFYSKAAGMGHLVIIDAELNVTNGYTFNLPKWKGTFELFDINPGSKNDGGINNTGGSALFMFCAGLGSGTSNPMNLSGTIVVGEGDISCPVNFGSGSSIQMDNVQFAHPITFSGNTKGSLNACRFTGGSDPAITMSSTGDVSIAGGIVESSNRLAITGNGSGTLKLVGSSFTENGEIASTLNLRSGKLRGAGQITRFVVGPAPDAPYQKIQDALNAAHIAGGGMVYVQRGNYRENLTFFENTQLVSIEYEDAGHTTLTGTHNPPPKGAIAIRGLRLASPTSVFKSHASGKANISILECTFAVDDGWVFDLPNWTGAFNINDCGSQLSTQDGVVNNRAGASVFTNNCQVGAGTTRAFTANGDVRLDLTFLDCPSKISGGTLFINFALFSKTMALSGTTTGSIILGDFFTGESPALTLTSSKPITLQQTSIDSSSTEVITGTGAVKIAGVNFLNSTGIAKTITSNRSAVFEIGQAHLDNLSFDRGGKSLNVDGELIIGSSKGKPQISTLTPGSGIDITNGEGSIMISQNNTIETSGKTIGEETVDLITLPLGNLPGTYTLEGLVSGFENTNPAGMGCQLFAAVRTTGTISSLIDKPFVKCNKDTALAGATADIVVSGNNAIVRVKGVKGLTIGWTVHLKYTAQKLE